MPQSAYGSNNSAKAVTIIICFIIIIAAIWAATSDVPGSFLSKTFFAPLAATTQPTASPTIISATPTLTVTSTPVSGSVQTITKQMNYPATEIYGVQLGAYNSLTNAKASVNDIVSMGGAGYIVTHGGYHKVYDFAYTNYNLASAKKEELKSKGYDACVTPIQIDGIFVDITASESQIEIIDNAYEVWLSSAETLYSLSNKYMNKTIGIIDVKHELSSVSSEISAASSALAPYKDNSMISQKLYDNLILCEDGLNSLEDTKVSDVEMLSSLKYLVMDFLCRFGSYANEIATIA